MAWLFRVKTRRPIKPSDLTTDETLAVLRAHGAPNLTDYIDDKGFFERPDSVTFYCDRPTSVSIDGGPRINVLKGDTLKVSGLRIRMNVEP